MQRIRFKFTKADRLIFISHLDVNRTIIRALKISGLPVAYSNGFNPRPLLTFALPLSLGISSRCETFDVTFTEELSALQAALSLNSSLRISGAIPGEVASVNTFSKRLCITEGYLPVMAPDDIKYADYNIDFFHDDNKTLENIKSKLYSFTELENIPVKKKSKSGVKTINLREKLVSIRLEQKKDCVSVALRLPAGNTENINPFLFTEAFYEFAGMKIESALERTAMVNAEGEEFL